MSNASRPKLLSEMTLDEMTPDQRARMLDHARFLAEGDAVGRAMPPTAIEQQREIERLDRESGLGITLADLGFAPGRVVKVTPDGVTIEDPKP